jgi:hypothetical protein
MYPCLTPSTQVYLTLPEYKQNIQIFPRVFKFTPNIQILPGVPDFSQNIQIYPQSTLLYPKYSRSTQCARVCSSLTEIFKP